MSVAGFDVGNCTSCVALARKRGVDVLMNSESKRETPALVSYGEKQRFIGVNGAAKLLMNVKNTVSEVKRLLGRKFSDPDVQKDLKNMMYEIEEGPDGGVLVNVQYLGERRKLTPEQVMASLLKDLKRIAEEDQGSAVTDCVLSVPAYYSEAERLAMLSSASLAGLKCLRLMNEPTATALAYGIFKTDLPEEQSIDVAFVDVGNSAMQVSIVAFKKGSMEVKSHAWDRNLGGRDLDEVLVRHFSDEFKAKHKLDVYSSQKALFRMRTSCERTRQMLTVNPQAPIAVECLIEDTDFRSEITRDAFEALAQSVLSRVDGPCQRALDMAGITAADLSSVEMVGAASRSPAIINTIQRVFGVAPQRTMNSKECVSRGCALQCAMLSPVFRVRDFDCKDFYPFAVNLSWEKDGATTTSQFFGPKTADGVTAQQSFPSTKTAKFFKTEPFTIHAAFADDCGLPDHVSKDIGDIHVKGLQKVPEGATNAAVTIHVGLDLHGLVKCTKAVQQWSEEYDEAVPEAAADAAPMDTDAAAPASADGAVGDDAAGKTVRKTRKVTVDAVVEQVSANGMTTAAYEKLFEEEGLMSASDALEEATSDAKNALEEYTYWLRGKLGDEYVKYASDNVRGQLIAELNDMENWLYEEGEDESKSVYELKLKELRAKGDPISLRCNETQTRAPAAKTLRELCAKYNNLAGSSDEKLAHIAEAEREQVRVEVSSALQWLSEKEEAQKKMALTDDPALLTSDIVKKAGVIERVCNPIMTKPAPFFAPKKETPAPAPETPAADADAAPMDADAAPAAEADAPAADAAAAPAADEAMAQ